MTRRIRQVRREFWSDSIVGRWPDAMRLFYIGLWCEADDDGYFDWDVPALAADLYRFATVASRERSVDRMLGLILADGRIRRLECGRHGVIPTLAEHQVIGGRKNYEVRDGHRRGCYASVAMADRGHPGPTMAVGMVGNGTERNGTVPGAPGREDAPDAPSEFAAAMERHGVRRRPVGFDTARRGLTSPTEGANTTDATPRHTTTEEGTR